MTKSEQRTANRIAYDMVVDCLPGRSLDEAQREAARQLGMIAPDAEGAASGRDARVRGFLRRAVKGSEGSSRATTWRGVP
jgi:hypothetical protein